MVSFTGIAQAFVLVVTDSRRPSESLFVVTWHGRLVEHVLEPQARTGVEKVTDESLLEVVETPRAQWLLGRYTQNLNNKSFPIHIPMHFLASMSMSSF